jgi:hypothetical protein
METMTGTGGAQMSFTRGGRRHYGPGDTIPDYRLDPPDYDEGDEDMTDEEREAAQDAADDAAIERFIDARDNGSW